jgi:hypothetical protein
VGSWQQIDEIFALSLRQEAARRGEWLEAACAGDPALRHEVESLLQAHEEARSFLEAPGFRLQAQQPAEPVERWVGRTAGPYTLLEVIGRGGMSTVLLAARSDEAFDRRVAVKIVHSGFTADHLRRRFLVERQILAQLDHPNIARLYDGGTTEEGQRARPQALQRHGRSMERV